MAAIALPAMAAVKPAGTNTVNVTGNIAKTGYLMIDINWRVDTAKYPGFTRDAIRDKVRDEMKSTVLGKVEPATAGLDISYERSAFTILKEYHDLLETRPDGTKVYALKYQVKFTAEPAPPPPPAPAATPPAPKKDKGFVLEQRWNNDM
jgi:hypothetical protein